jgi:hypothetical protein
MFDQFRAVNGCHQRPACWARGQLFIVHRAMELLWDGKSCAACRRNLHLPHPPQCDRGEKNLLLLSLREEFGVGHDLEFQFCAAGLRGHGFLQLHAGQGGTLLFSTTSFDGRALSRLPRYVIDGGKIRLPAFSWRRPPQIKITSPARFASPASASVIFLSATAHFNVSSRYCS